MRLTMLKVLAVFAVLSILLGLSAASLIAQGKAKNSDYIKVEMKGELRTYRMTLFGETAAGVKADDVEIFLDYSKNDEIKKKRIGYFDKKTVCVKGKLEFRDFAIRLEVVRGGEGPKPFSLRGLPVIVVESLEEIK